MINSRDPTQLLPTVRQMHKDFLSECADEGIEILTTSTFRDHASQARLYAQGRTAPGSIVTNAAPGWSWHQWRCAFDVVPLLHGKPVWGTIGEDLKLWQRIGAIGESVGLEWAGRWTHFREYPHFQHTFGRTIQDVNKGTPLPEGLDGTIYTIQTSPTVHSRISSYLGGMPRRVMAYFQNGKGDNHG